MDLITEILGPHHFFLRRDAIASGLTDRELYGLVRNGTLHRVRQGAYTTRQHWHGLPVEDRHLLRARCVVRSAAVRVALCHTTAALVHGAPVWGLPLDEVHVVRLDGRTGRREAGVRQHGHDLVAEDLVQVDDLLVTGVAQTCIDITTIARVEVALGVLDHFLHVGTVSKDELVRRVEHLSSRPGSLGSELACRLADGRSESVGESRLRYRCWVSHLPHPVPQFEIRERGRLLHRLDFAWPQHGVWLEFDGREKYTKYRRPGESVIDAVLREKKREEQIALRTGWRCIRVTWADLRDPDRLVARIAAVLAGGPVHV